MKLKVINWKFERVNKGEETLTLPDKTVYFFVGGIREICKVEPRYDHENKIYGYTFSSFGNQFSKVNFNQFNVSLSDIENVHYGKEKRVTPNDELVECFMYEKYYTRTKENYESEINGFKEML